MAEYETICLACDHVWDQSHSVHAAHEPCPNCRSEKVSRYFGNGLHTSVSAASLDTGWERENGGRGRYFSQLEQSATCTRSPENCFRSRNEAIEACKRRGFDIISK